MKHLYRILCLIMLSSALPGCMSYLPITRHLPPEIILGKDQQSIQIVNLFDYTLVDYSNEKRNDLFKMGVNTIMESLRASFSKNPDFFVFVNDSLIQGENRAFLSDALSAYSVQLFCNENNTSLLLALESFDIDYDKEIEVEEDENGKETKTALFYLVVNAGLSLYNSNGTVVDRSTLTRREYTNSRSVIALDMAFRPSYANKQKEIARMARDIGLSYANKFQPSSYDEPRSFYSSREFTEVKPLMMNREWQKAIDLLVPLAGSENKRVAKRAAHNLSVVYDAMGNSKESEYWFQKSLEK